MSLDFVRNRATCPASQADIEMMLQQQDAFVAALNTTPKEGTLK